jgi:hypothetical protein
VSRNSEVAASWLVAVAVTNCPLGTFFLVLKVKVAMPLELVVTLFWNLNVLPSPKPESSASGLAKNCKVNVVLALLLSVPLMMVTFLLCPPIRLVVSLAEVISGKFCRLLGPVSLSGGERGRCR